MITAVLFLFGILAMLCPVIVRIVNLEISWIAVVVLEIIGVLLIGAGGYLSLFKKFFKIPKANEAIIRTGKGKTTKDKDGKNVPEEPEVAIGYGLWVIPMFHQFIEFRFQQFVFPIDKKGAEALQCSDGRLADVSATCKVSVPQTKEAVLKFLAAAGTRKPNEKETYKELTYDTLETSLRDAATNRPYDSVFKGREEVAAEVEKSVEDDFSKIGIQLDTVKLREVEPTAINFYKDDNPQHAVGKTAITVITEDQRLATQTKILATNQLVKEKEVGTKKQILTLEEDQAIAQAVQEKTIKIQQAENDREAREKVIEQQELLGKREIVKSLVIENETVNKNKTIALATLQQEREVAEGLVAKSTAVELAQRNQDIAIATKETEKAATEQSRQEAEARAEKARQDVQTVQVTETANREKSKKVIDKQATVEQTRLEAQMNADVEAYAITKEAEGRKQAAEADFEAKTKAAEADFITKTKAAEGLLAEQMVPVKVSARQVEIDKQRLDTVTIPELAAKSEHSKVSIELTLGQLKIQAEKEVGIAYANALGIMSANAKMNIYGDPDTLAKMSDKFMNGHGISQAVEGFLDGGAGGLTKLMPALASLVKKTGVDLSGKTKAGSLEEEKVTDKPEA